MITYLRLFWHWLRAFFVRAIPAPVPPPELPSPLIPEPPAVLPAESPQEEPTFTMITLGVTGFFRGGVVSKDAFNRVDF